MPRAQKRITPGKPKRPGCDAHQPPWVSDPASEEKATAMAERLGLKLLRQLPIRSLSPERG